MPRFLRYRFLLGGILGILGSLPLAAQTPDTTYTKSPNLGSTTSIYPEYYQILRRDSVMGFVLFGNPNAGSCARVWCAIVPTSSGYGQSGGTFASFDPAAHEVVRVWNSRHPGDTLATPIVTPPPTDTVPSVPSVDSSYTTTRILPNPPGSITAYRVFHRDTLVGTVIQAPQGRWSAIPPDTTAPIGIWSTLRSAAYALVHRYQHPVIPSPTDTTRIPVTIYDTTHVRVTRYDTTHVPIVIRDTTHATLTIIDTIRTTVTLPPDTLRPRVILPVDTVVMRVGDPPLVLQTGDTVKIPIQVLPPCLCADTTTPPTAAVDNVARTIPVGTTVLAAGVDTIGLHIYDWPTRVGDNSVYLGTVYLGRITYQGTSPSVTWIAYRALVSDPDPMILRRDCATYATKADAMRALASFPSAYSWRTIQTRMVLDPVNGCVNPPPR